MLNVTERLINKTSELTSEAVITPEYTETLINYIDNYQNYIDNIKTDINHYPELKNKINKILENIPV
jgi:hypothetical protein